MRVDVEGREEFNVHLLLRDAVGIAVFVELQPAKSAPPIKRYIGSHPSPLPSMEQYLRDELHNQLFAPIHDRADKDAKEDIDKSSEIGARLGTFIFLAVDKNQRCK